MIGGGWIALWLDTHQNVNMFIWDPVGRWESMERA